MKVTSPGNRRASVLACIAEQFLYLFPAHAGKVLLDQYSNIPASQEQAKWIRAVLDWNADEIAEWISREGDEEDKMVMLNVFLWKQRHGLIDPSRRIHYIFSKWPDGFYIQRYMVANGYQDIVTLPQYRDQPNGHLHEVNSLLNAFLAGGLREDDLWGLLLRLNVLGPSLDTYERRDDVLKLATYILSTADCAKLRDVSNDVCLSSLGSLLWDLRMEPTKTWVVFSSFLQHPRERSVACYPALKAGLDMYGEQMRKILQNIDLQGGTDLFLAFAGVNW